MAEIAPSAGPLAQAFARLNRFAALFGFGGILLLTLFARKNWFVALRDAWSAETLLRQQTGVPPWIPPPRTVVLHVPAERPVVGMIDHATDSFDHATLAEFSGWVGATGHEQAIKKVVVLVDGKPLAETVRLRPFAFPDVFFDKPDFLPLGWRVEFPAQKIPPGLHIVTASAVLADGSTAAFDHSQTNRPKP